MRQMLVVAQHNEWRAVDAGVNRARAVASGGGTVISRRQNRDRTQIQFTECVILLDVIHLPYIFAGPIGLDQIAIFSLRVLRFCLSCALLIHRWLVQIQLVLDGLAFGTFIHVICVGALRLALVWFSGCSSHTCHRRVERFIEQR